MTEKRIVGIDIGSYSVKVVYLDPKAGDLSVLGYDRQGVEAALAAISSGSGVEDSSPAVAATDGAPPPMPTDAPGTAGPVDATGPTSFDDEPTNVREAPLDTEDTVESPEAGSDESIKDSAEVDRAAELPFDSPDWVAALQQLDARDALAGALQATFVPDGKAMTIDLEVPFEEKAKVANILPHLLMDRLPFAPQDIVWDFQTYPSHDPAAEGGRAMVGLARNEDLEEALRFLGEGGVDPAMLGIPEMQLAAIGVRLLGGPQAEPVAFVDLGHETTRVVVVDGWNPLLGRTIRTGGRQLTESIAEQFGSTIAEAAKVKHQYAAIVDEASGPSEEMKRLSGAIEDGLRPVVRDLRRTLQGLYAKSRVEVARVFICGGTSQVRNLERFLSAELGITVRRLPTNVPGMMDSQSSATGMMALAAAYTYQNEAARNRTVNLRKGRFAYRGRSSYLRRQMMFAAAAIFGLLFVLAISLFIQKLSYEAQRDAMQSALATQTKALFGAELDSKTAVQSMMEGDQGGANSFVPKMSAYEILHELTTTLSSDVEIELDRIEVDTDRNLIQIYGETTDAQAVDKIVSDLEKIECLKEIKKDKLRVRDDKADFELQISSECS